MLRPHVAAASWDLSGAHVAVVADASGLAAHASSGMWVGPNEPNQAVQKDGWFREPIPFEPLCNCNGIIHDVRPASGYSQAWMAAVVADVKWRHLFSIFLLSR